MANDTQTTIDPGGEPPAPDERRPAPQDDNVHVIDRRWWARAAAEEEGAAGAERSDKPSYVQDLEQRLAAKDEELRTTISRYREANAEFEQARVRLRRDVAKEVERGKRAILADLLDVVDNLDRALGAARSGSVEGPLLQGVEMVRGQFLAKLEGFGVRPIHAVDQVFDPACHEAATIVPVTDAGRDGLVVGVIRQGYVIGDDVLRPAVVAVAKFGSEGAPS